MKVNTCSLTIWGRLGFDGDQRYHVLQAELKALVKRLHFLDANTDKTVAVNTNTGVDFALVV